VRTPPARAVRRATAADRRFVLDLAEASFALLGAYRPILERRLEQPATTTWIATAESAAVGMAIVARQQPPGFLASALGELVAIAVDEPWQGAGFGRDLLAAAERTALRWGAREMRLHTAETNARAQDFFLAAGYRPGRRDVRYPSGVAALELRCPLDEPRPPRPPGLIRRAPGGIARGARRPGSGSDSGRRS
jgi:ribosomal protein S18 acetylase RimI-like enzyme